MLVMEILFNVQRILGKYKLINITNIKLAFNRIYLELNLHQSRMLDILCKSK